MNPKVEYKKLGRENAWGLAYDELRKIVLDPRLFGKKHLNISIHELLHIQNPEWSETKVKQKSKELANFLWGLHYRRVDNREKQR